MSHQTLALSLEYREGAIRSPLPASPRVNLGRGTAATALGELERFEGRWTAARSLYEAALAGTRRQGDLRCIITNLNNLAMTAMAQGEVAGTRELLIESVRLQDNSAFS